MTVPYLVTCTLMLSLISSSASYQWKELEVSPNFRLPKAKMISPPDLRNIFQTNRHMIIFWRWQHFQFNNKHAIDHYVNLYHLIVKVKDSFNFQRNHRLKMPPTQFPTIPGLEFRPPSVRRQLGHYTQIFTAHHWWKPRDLGEGAQRDSGEAGVRCTLRLVRGSTHSTRTSRWRCCNVQPLVPPSFPTSLAQVKTV